MSVEKANFREPPLHAEEKSLATKVKSAFFILFLLGAGILIFRGHSYGKWTLLIAFFFSLPLPLYLIFHWLNVLAPRFSTSDTPWSHLISSLLVLAIYVGVLLALFHANDWYRSFLLSREVVRVPAIINGEKVVGTKRATNKILLFDYTIDGTEYDGKISVDLTHKRVGDTLQVIVSSWDKGVYLVAQ